MCVFVVYYGRPRDLALGVRRHVRMCIRDSVFTRALVAGWRPAESPFITAIITLKDHPEGTEYAAHVMHKNGADRTMHDEAGFADGWGTAIGQLEHCPLHTSPSPRDRTSPRMPSSA